MEVDHNRRDDPEAALAELARLIGDALLQDPSVIDGGSHLEIHLDTTDFREKLSAILSRAIADIPSSVLMAMAIGKARQERRLDKLHVLADDDLPPGFSSN